MLIDPVSLLAVHHVERAQLVAAASCGAPRRPANWRRRAHRVWVFVLRRAYVRARASYVAAGRPA